MLPDNSTDVMSITVLDCRRMEVQKMLVDAVNFNDWAELFEAFA